MGDNRFFYITPFFSAGRSEVAGQMPIFITVKYILYWIFLYSTCMYLYIWDLFGVIPKLCLSHHAKLPTSKRVKACIIIKHIEI